MIVNGAVHTIQSQRGAQSGADRSQHGTGFILWASAACFAAFIAWSLWANLDIVSRATGTVIPESRVQTIQSIDGGILESLRVREGDIVEAGQLLASFDRIKADSQYREALSKVVSVQAALLRARAEVAGRPPEFPSEMKEFPEIVEAQQMLYRKRRSALQEELAVLERSLELAVAELALNEPMLETGEVSQVEVIRLRRQVNEIRGGITQRRNKYLADAQAELARSQDDYGSLSEILSGRKDTVDHVEVRAPVAGVVKNIRFNTIGGVVRPAEEILQIVPLEEEMLIELKLKPADIAFLKPGLPALVKMDAYDYTIYGTLRGELIYMSPDTLREDNAREDIRYYRGLVRIRSDKLRHQEKQEISRAMSIIPGMTASVDIKTGEQSVLSYLLKPLVKSVKEGFHER